jgi:hypothetical protein
MKPWRRPRPTQGCITSKEEEVILFVVLEIF